MSRGRAVLLLVLPSLVVAAWWWLGRPDAPPLVVRWVAHENVFEALLNGEVVRTTEVLDAGTLRGQAQTFEVDPRDFSKAEGMVSNPLGAPPYAWCVGLHSGFDLDVLEPQGRRLHIELANGTEAPQHVSVAFNGQAVIEQDLPVGGPATTLLAEIPAAAQVPGSNRVDFTFAQTETRQLIGQPVELPIAGVLTHAHFLRTDRVERLPGPPPPLGLQTETGPRGPRAVLVLPPGTSARAPLRLPAAPRVALRFQLERLGTPFELWLTGDSGVRKRLVRVEAQDFSARELQIDLSDWAGQIALLDFWSLDGSAESTQISAAVVLVPDDWAARTRAVASSGDAPRDAARDAPGNASRIASAADSVAPAARRSFLLVTLDAFARRQLGVVGPAADVAPRLTELGARGSVFRETTSMASYTLASVATLLTGQSPLRHGVTLALETIGDGSVPGRLRDDAPCLARALAEQGWRTAAFVTNPNAGARHGFGVGFEHFDELFLDETLWDRGVAGEHLAPRLAAWLAETGTQPFFAWVHVFEPHAPYDSPPDLRARWVAPYDGPVRGDREWIDAYRFGDVAVDAAGWKHLRELYAARMALADRTLGALLDTLQASGRAQDTVVIVTGDHGEALGEHGQIEHGDSVYSEELDVPLALLVPGAASASVGGPASLADIAPTLLALAGVARPAGMDGVDLLAGELDTHRALFARSSERLPKLSWTRGAMRLIVDLGTRRRELYDLVRDPGETVNLLRQRPATAAQLMRELLEAVCAAEAERAARAAAAPTTDPAATVIDPAQSEQLHSIGYAGSGSPAPSPDQPAQSQCERLRALLRRT